MKKSKGLSEREKALIKEAYKIGHFHGSDIIAKRIKYPMGGMFGVYNWCLDHVAKAAKKVRKG